MARSEGPGYACKLNNDNYTQEIQITGLKKEMFEGNRFSLDMWLYPEGDKTSYGLLMQANPPGSANANNFVFAVQDQLPYLLLFRENGVKRIDCAHPLLKIENNQWNHLFITYDGFVLKFYIQGILAGSEEVLNESVFSSLIEEKPCVVGGYANSLIHSLRLYSREIAEEDFEKYIYEDAYNSPQMPYMVCFLRGNFQSQGIDNLCGGSVEAGFYGSISVVQVSGMWPAFGVLPDIFLNKAYSVYETGNPEHPGRLEIKGIPSGVLDPHHFSFDIWFYPTEDRAYSLLSQSSNFQIGVQSDGVLYFHHPSIGKFSVSEKFKIQKNIWNHVFFVYDAARADFYLQGYLVYSEKVGSTAFVNDTPYLAGDGFCGFIRSLRVYGKALKREEVSRYIYEKSYDEEKMPDAALFLVSERHGEKGKLEIRNLSNISVEIEKSSSCALGYVTPVYESRKEDGIAAWAGDTALERELFSPGQPFSMFVKFYVLPSDNNNQSLISTFLSLTQFGMGIKREAGSKAFLPYVRLETSPVCVGEKEIKEEEWNDLLISYDGSKLTMFVNGEDCGSFEIDSFPANEFSEENPGGMLVLCTSMWEEGGLSNPARFVGYLRNAALFTKALKREDAEAFHINEPFLYEDGLKALYNFDNKVPLDLVRREPFSLFASGSSKLVSVYGNPVWGEEERIRITKPVPSYSDELLRQASLLLIPILKYCGYFYGLEVKEEFRQLFLNYSAKDFIGSFSDVAVVEKVSVSDQTTQEDILDLLKSVNIEKFSGMFLSLCLNSRQNGTAQVADSVFAIANSWARNLDFFQQMSSFSGLSLIQTALSESLSEIERVKKENLPSFKKAYYACEIDNTGPLQESYLEISETRWESLDPHHFSFDIWFYPKEKKEYSLLSQGSGLQLRVRRDGSLDFSYPAVGGFSSSSDFKVQKNCWNHIFFIYDANTIAFYLQGYRIYFGDVGSTSLIGMGPLLIGQGFSGYIRSVRVYGEAVLEKDFPKYLYQNDYAEESMPGVKLFLQCRMNEDGTQLEVKDIGPSSFPVALRGKCGAKMVTPAYVFDGHACLEDPDESTNPGNFESGEFSIYAKIRFERNEAGNQPVMSLFSNIYDLSTLSKGVNVYFYSLVSNCSFRIGAGIGRNGASGNIDILPERWTDIMVVYGQNSLTFYVNGELDSHFKDFYVESGLRGGVRLGEKTEGTGMINFQGSVAKIAVFDKALSEDDVAAFHENEPFIYEDGLRALYSFDDGFGAVELLKGKRLNGALADFSQLVCVPISPLSSMYEYRTTREVPEYTQEELYIASLLLNIFLMYYRGFYGLEAEDEKRETFLRYFASTFLDFFSNSALCEKISGAERVSPEDIVGLLKLFDVEKFSGMFSSLWLDTLQNRGEAIRDSILAVSGSLARNQVFSGSLDSFSETERVSSLIGEITKAINKEKPNDNKKAYYACRVDHKGTNKSIRIEGMDPSLLRDGKEFSFDLWFYPDPGSEEYCLLSQEGGFSCGVTKEGNFYFTYPSVDRIETSDEKFKVTNNAWNHFFFVYNEGVLTFFFFGTLFYSAEVEIETLVATSPFQLGKGFSGFMNILRVYRKAISALDIKKYLYQAELDEEKTPEIAAFFDLVNWEVKLGKDVAALTLPPVRPATCKLTNVINAYVPRKEGCYPIDQSKVNLGSFSGENFSIYLRFYFNPEIEETNEKQILFSLGNFEDSNRMIVYITRGGNGVFTPCVDLGAVTLKGKKKLEDFQWSEIAITYNGENKNLTLFLNGRHAGFTVISGLTPQFEWDNGKSITFGNGLQTKNGTQTFPFSGCLTLVALFNRALSEKDIVAFVENEPFIYERGLSALFSFERGIAMELLSEEEEALEKYTSDIFLVTGTNKNDVWEEYVFRVDNMKPDYSVEILGKASIALDVYAGFYMVTYGLEINEDDLELYRDYFANQIVEEIEKDETFKDKFPSREEMTEDLMKKMTSIMLKNAKTFKLYGYRKTFVSLPTGGGVGIGLSCISFFSSVTFSFFTCCLGGGGYSGVPQSPRPSTPPNRIHGPLSNGGSTCLPACLTGAAAKKAVEVLLVILAVATIGGIIWLIFFNKKKTQPSVREIKSRLKLMATLSSIKFNGTRPFRQIDTTGESLTLKAGGGDSVTYHWKSETETENAILNPVLYVGKDGEEDGITGNVEVELTTCVVIRIPFKDGGEEGNLWGRLTATLDDLNLLDGNALNFEFNNIDQGEGFYDRTDFPIENEVDLDDLKGSLSGAALEKVKDVMNKLAFTGEKLKDLENKINNKLKKMDEDLKYSLRGIEIDISIPALEELNKLLKCDLEISGGEESSDAGSIQPFQGFCGNHPHIGIGEKLGIALSGDLVKKDYPYKGDPGDWPYKVKSITMEIPSSASDGATMKSTLTTNVKGKCNNLGLRFYVLPSDFSNQSNSLISFTDTSKYPVIELVELICLRTPPEGNDVLKGMTSQLYQNQFLTYDVMPKYTRIENRKEEELKESYLQDVPAFEGGIYVRFINMMKFLDFYTNFINFYIKASNSHEDFWGFFKNEYSIHTEGSIYAIILGYGFALLGEEANVCHIQGIGSQKRPLKTRKVQGVLQSLFNKGPSKEYQFDSHMAVKYKGKIYDAPFNQAGVDFMDHSHVHSFNNVNDSESYRKKVFQDNTRVFITEEFPLRSVFGRLDSFSYIVIELYKGRPQ